MTSLKNKRIKKLEQNKDLAATIYRRETRKTADHQKRALLRANRLEAEAAWLRGLISALSKNNAAIAAADQQLTQDLAKLKQANVEKEEFNKIILLATKTTQAATKLVTLIA